MLGVAFTWGGKRRRSNQILEQDFQKAQPGQTINKRKEIYYDWEKAPKQSRRRKMGIQIEENHEDKYSGDAISTIGIPEKGKLELLLNTLRKTDVDGVFEMAVNPDEVKDYHNVVKEPMEFEMISTKLNGGSYRTLQDFEHDVLLVFNNVMRLNPPNAVKFIQACAMEKLAKTLFHALKTNPQNFETECSKRRLGTGRTKAELELLDSNSCKTTVNSGTASKSKGKSEFQNRRKAYCPQKASSVHKDSEALPQIKNNTARIESLSSFSKELGSTAQMVAKRKEDKCMDDVMNVVDKNSNLPLQSLELHSHGAGPAFQRDISNVPSIKNGSVDIGEHTIDLKTARNRSIAHFMERRSLLKMQGKTFPSGNINRVSTVNESLCKSQGKKVLSGGIFGDNDVTAMLDDINVKKIDTLHNSLDIHPARRGMTDQISDMLPSSFPISATGDEKRVSPGGWNANNSFKHMSFTQLLTDNSLDKDLDFLGQIAVMGSSDSAGQVLLPQKNSGALSFMLPSESNAAGMTGRLPVSSVDQMDFNHIGKEVPQFQFFPERTGLTDRTNCDHGDKTLNLFKQDKLRSECNADASNQGIIDLGNKTLDLFKPEMVKGCSANAFSQQNSMTRKVDLSGLAGPSLLSSKFSNPMSDGGLNKPEGFSMGGGVLSNWFNKLESKNEQNVIGQSQWGSGPSKIHLSNGTGSLQLRSQFADPTLDRGLGQIPGVELGGSIMLDQRKKVDLGNKKLPTSNLLSISKSFDVRPKEIVMGLFKEPRPSKQDRGVGSSSRPETFQLHSKTAGQPVKSRWDYRRQAGHSSSDRRPFNQSSVSNVSGLEKLSKPSSGLFGTPILQMQHNGPIETSSNLQLKNLWDLLKDNSQKQLKSSELNSTSLDGSSRLQQQQQQQQEGWFHTVPYQLHSSPQDLLKPSNDSFPNHLKSSEVHATAPSGTSRLDSGQHGHVTSSADQQASNPTKLDANDNFVRKVIKWVDTYDPGTIWSKDMLD